MCKKFSWKAFGSEKPLIQSIIHQQFLIHVLYNKAIILMDLDRTRQFLSESVSVPTPVTYEDFLSVHKNV